MRLRQSELPRPDVTWRVSVRTGVVEENGAELVFEGEGATPEAARAGLNEQAAFVMDAAEDATRALL